MAPGAPYPKGAFNLSGDPAPSLRTPPPTIEPSAVLVELAEGQLKYQEYPAADRAASLRGLTRSGVVCFLGVLSLGGN